MIYKCLNLWSRNKDCILHICKTIKIYKELKQNQIVLIHIKIWIKNLAKNRYKGIKIYQQWRTQ